MPDIFADNTILPFLAFFIPGFLGMSIYSLFVATTERDFIKQLPAAIAYSTLHYALTLWIILIAPAGWPQLVAAYVVVFILPLVWAPELLIVRGGHAYEDIFSPRIRDLMLRPEATPWERLFAPNLETERWIRITSKTHANRSILVTITDDDIVEVLESNHARPATEGEQHRG